jgi:rubrerythrin
MDLKGHKLEDIFLSAIKAEADSREAYSIMAGITRNSFLKSRLRFLADEEESHRKLLEAQYAARFKGSMPPLPEVSPVPLPEIDTKSEGVPISDLLEQAMEAESAARDFYLSFAKFVRAERELVALLNYFARMEEGHYELLKREKASAEDFEAFDDFNPGMHMGP